MKRIILKVLFKLRILKYLNFTLSVNKYGKTFTIPLLGATGLDLFFSDKEAWMLSALRKMNDLTGGKGAFIDVGANIGQTLLKVKHLANDWQYVGFEPNPNCLQYLFTLVNANRFPNTRILPFGLSDRCMIGNLSLFNNSPVDTSASVVTGFRSDATSSLSVALIACDEMPDLFKSKVSVVKIDVEGGELEVLKALRSTIQRDCPYILCEVLPVYADANHLRLNRQLELEKILHDLGYLKFRIHADVKLSYCQEIGVHDSMESVNYMFCPEHSYNLIMDTFEIS